MPARIVTPNPTCGAFVSCTSLSDPHESQDDRAHRRTQRDETLHHGSHPGDGCAAPVIGRPGGEGGGNDLLELLVVDCVGPEEGHFTRTAPHGGRYLEGGVALEGRCVVE